jgi:predicted nucleotidyltransferase
MTMPETRTLDDIQNQLQSIRPQLRDEFGVSELKVFGAYVREEQTPDSDLDLLVSFRDQPPGLLALLRLEHMISDTIGIKVDLVVEDALKEHVKETADRDMISI